MYMRQSEPYGAPSITKSQVDWKVPSSLVLHSALFPCVRRFYVFDSLSVVSVSLCRCCRSWSPRVQMKHSFPRKAVCLFLVFVWLFVN